MVKIIDYDEKFLNQIEILDGDYWGRNSQEKYGDTINEHSLIKLAIEDNKLIGLIHCQIIGDLLDIYHLLIQQDYQKRGIGTLLMNAIMEEVDKRNIQNSIANAVITKGEHMNAEKILLHFGYQEMYRVNDYWHSLEPDIYCSACKSNNCKCGSAFFLKHFK